MVSVLTPGRLPTTDHCTALLKVLRRTSLLPSEIDALGWNGSAFEPWAAVEAQFKRYFWPYDAGNVTCGPPPLGLGPAKAAVANSSCIPLCIALGRSVHRRARPGQYNPLAFLVGVLPAVEPQGADGIDWLLRTREVLEAGLPTAPADIAGYVIVRAVAWAAGLCGVACFSRVTRTCNVLQRIAGRPDL